MKIYLGSDHRGYFLKEKIAKWLFEWQYEFFDVGAQNLELGDDYTKYAAEAASLVAKTQGGRGIVLCGSGVGVDVIVNKFDGIRASIGINADQIRAGREHDDMNVLVIAADYTDEYEAKDMIKAFLETKFDEKSRHKRRLKDIEKIEANN
jgi:ribose 5-phosphate isomerase B